MNAMDDFLTVLAELRVELQRAFRDRTPTPTDSFRRSYVGGSRGPTWVTQVSVKATSAAPDAIHQGDIYHWIVTPRATCSAHQLHAALCDRVVFYLRAALKTEATPSLPARGLVEALTAWGQMHIDLLGDGGRARVPSGTVRGAGRSTHKLEPNPKEARFEASWDADGGAVVGVYTLPFVWTPADDPDTHLPPSDFLRPLQPLSIRVAVAPHESVEAALHRDVRARSTRAQEALARALDALQALGGP